MVTYAGMFGERAPTARAITEPKDGFCGAFRARVGPK
jgi:hypothetical protein